MECGNFSDAPIEHWMCCVNDDDTRARTHHFVCVPLSTNVSIVWLVLAFFPARFAHTVNVGWPGQVRHTRPVLPVHGHNGVWWWSDTSIRWWALHTHTHTKLTPRWRLLHVTNDGNAFALAARQTIFVELSAFRAQMQPQHIYNVNAHTLFMSNQIVNDASACLFNVNVCCQYSLTHSSRWALVIRRRRRRLRLRWCTDVHNQQSISASSTLLVAYIVRTYIQSVSPSSVVGPLRWPSNWINGSWENCTESVEGNIWCCEIVFGAMTKVTYILSHGGQRCRASGLRLMRQYAANSFDSRKFLINKIVWEAEGCVAVTNRSKHGNTFDPLAVCISPFWLSSTSG